MMQFVHAWPSLLFSPVKEVLVYNNYYGIFCIIDIWL